MQNIKEEDVALDEAKSKDNFYAIFWGDGGDIIYLTSPVNLIKIDELSLYKLVFAIDEVLWYEDDSRDIYYQKFNVFPSVVEGDKGMILKGEIWFNNKIKDGAKKIIRDIITGKINISETPEELINLKAMLR